MKKLFTLVMLTLLTACNTAPTVAPLTPISFANQPPFRMNVAEIRIDENYRSPMKAPNVEHHFPTAPANAVKVWVKDRLQAAGTTGVMVVSIDDASIVESSLPKTEGFKGFFTDDQEARYDGKLNVTFRLYTGMQAMADAEGNVQVNYGRTINEKATAAEREQFNDALVKEIMRLFDGEATTRIGQYFAAHTLN